MKHLKNGNLAFFLAALVLLYIIITLSSCSLAKGLKIEIKPRTKVLKEMGIKVDVNLSLKKAISAPDSTILK